MDEFICRDRAFFFVGDSHLVGSLRFPILSLRLMVEPIYQPRDPKVSPLYQSILNHFAEFEYGYKMTGVGKLVARHLVTGEAVEELQPFAFNRSQNGGAYGSRTTHCPWV